MNGRVLDPRSSSAVREHELLARLGLGPGASNDEVEAAHDEILDYLAAAPNALRGWARVQLTEADEAYARLSGSPASAASPPDLMTATGMTAPTVATSPRKASGGASSPIPNATPAIRGGLDNDFDGFYDEADETSGPVVITRRDRRPTASKAVRVQALSNDRAGASSGLVIPRGTARALAAVGAVVVLIVGVAGVYNLGGGAVPGINGTPAPQASSGLDMAQVADLMQKISTNPKDTASLMSLATLYYGIGDYTTAQTWLQKVLDVDPKNVTALLALGASEFNTGDDASAETVWRQVLTIDPKNVEAHYDLGFMYFSKSPPDIEKVREEWGAVITLAPDSEVAQTVQAHLASLGSPAPSSGASGVPAGSPAAGSPAPAGSPTPAASPAPTPAAS